MDVDGHESSIWPHRAHGPLPIERWLPLGSITFVSEAHAKGINDWTETEHFLECLPPDHFLYGDVSRLATVGWIRLFHRRHQNDSSLATLRVYYLPDDVARGVLSRADRKARRSVGALMEAIDSSSDSWLGCGSQESLASRYEAKCEENDSLFYIFNTLNSPRPQPERMKNRYVREALEDLLAGSAYVPGLKTDLYGYQRRSAALMIQRESQPSLSLDTRLEMLYGPTAQAFYYDRITAELFSEKRHYEEARGGILAETMGYGKTLISLAAVLITKDHMPCIPPEHAVNMPEIVVTEGCRPLAAIAASTILRSNMPWELHFRDLARQGEHYERCVEELTREKCSYFVSQENSTRRVLSCRRIFLTRTTLIVVPPNLLSQWKHQIDMHVEKEALSILVVEDMTTELPSASMLLEYHVILMNKNRFDRELATRKDIRHCSMSCHCTISGVGGSCRWTVYRSPLLDLHFLRFIVDEGHTFAGSGMKSTAGRGISSIRAERRWIITGTPAGGLIGVEVDLAASESGHAETSNVSEGSPSRKTRAENGKQEGRKASLRDDELLARRGDYALARERADLSKLGRIVIDFLKVQPWSNMKGGLDYGSWEQYVMPTAQGQRKPASLRNILQGFIVRHRIEEVEHDLELPPLQNRIVYLEPSYFDKLSINLFIFTLTANAITSERVDVDYIHHPINRRRLDDLFRNLRQSGFYWCSLTVQDLSETIRVSREYLDNPEHKVMDEDREQLERCIGVGQAALDSPAWVAFAETNEMGLFVDRFPQNARRSWSLCPQQDDHGLIMGATHVCKAQLYIDKHAHEFDAMLGLAAAGRATIHVRELTHSPKKPTLDKDIPEPSTQVLQGSSGNEFDMYQAKTRTSGVTAGSTVALESHAQNTGLKSALKVASSPLPFSPPHNEALEATMLAGTVSAKLTYLIDRIVELHHNEKILIFYFGDHIAWYIAQALEVLSIPHFIYASKLKLDLRTKYLRDFETSPTERVMLMDVRQGAHGLHIACASRIFFVNPIWQVNVEAQAIKRAHRIGQKKPVYVETLVLKGTLEDKMLQRRKAMTSQEHEKACGDPLEDEKMADIIKNAKYIPLSEDERQDGRKQMALLKVPQPLFGRNLSKGVKTDSRQKKRKAAFADSTDAMGDIRCTSRPKKVARFDVDVAATGALEQYNHFPD